MDTKEKLYFENLIEWAKKLTITILLLLTIFLMGSYQSQKEYHQRRVIYYQKKVAEAQKQISFHQKKIYYYEKLEQKK